MHSKKYDTLLARRANSAALVINVLVVAVSVLISVMFLISWERHHNFNALMEEKLQAWRNIERQYKVDLKRIAEEPTLQAMMANIQQNIRTELEKADQIDDELERLLSQPNVLPEGISRKFVGRLPGFEEVQIEARIKSKVHDFIDYPPEYASIGLQSWDGEDQFYFLTGAYLEKLIFVLERVRKEQEERNKFIFAIWILAGLFPVLSNILTSRLVMTPAFAALDGSYQRTIEYYEKLRESDQMISGAFTALDIPMCIFDIHWQTRLQNQAFVTKISDQFPECQGSMRMLVPRLVFPNAKRKDISIDELIAVSHYPSLNDHVSIADRLYRFQSAVIGDGLFLLIGRDDTLEVNARRAELTRGRMESLGQLSSGIAHDFNNILATIMVNSEYIQSLALSPEDTRKQIEQTIIACERGEALVSQISNFVRPATPRREVLTITDFAHLIRDQLRVPRRNIELHVSGYGSTSFMCDSAMLITAIENLVKNAGDAIGDETPGHIYVEISEVESPQKTVCIRVRDTGAGFSAEALAKGFDPFYSTKNPGKGLGLGLAMVAQMVELNSGRVSLRNWAEGGEVKIWLPAKKESRRGASDVAAAAHKIYAPDAPHDGTVCLFLEDEETIRRAQSRMLEYKFENVFAYGTNAEFEASLKALPRCDAALMDWNLPDGVSETSIRALRARFPKAKILVYTGATTPELLRLSQNLSFDIAEKPLRFEQIIQRLDLRKVPVRPPDDLPTYLN